MKNRNITIFVLLIASILIFVFVVQGNKIIETKLPSNEIQFVGIAGTMVEVELALTAEEKEQGLSGRDGLGENQGMLFVFSQPGRYSFWMKDMNFPIDIIWLGAALQVVYIKENARPESFPESFGLDAEAKYVLEVLAGFAEKYNLKVGDRAELIYE